ncbi:Bug family tripartite tricarboxylate transporter substrate binding protein [Pseudorhodoplanes sp.]|uniref:Bug family tripartite tricarboxylate transporter substrate binding protein n=1 Tax=Pseudorhodoplanes sp. TaxID=1934341 RepID=UPI003D099DA8
MQRRVLLSAALGTMLLSCGAADLNAQANDRYPSQPIRVIVPYSAGAGVDILTRTIGSKLSDRMGQPVVVENRPGASGNIGILAAARSQPDGYTLVMVVNTFATNAAFNPGAYDPISDFSPIGLVGRNGMVLVANPSIQVNSVEDLIARAKANPGKLNYASVGPGSPQHLGMELFNQAFKVNLFHIPFANAAAANLAVTRGDVDVMLMPVNVALGPIKSKQLVPLAVAAPQRLPELADLKPLAESGAPGFDVGVWYALLAPAGTSQSITDRVYREIASILLEKDVLEILGKLGIKADPLASDEFKTLVKREHARWTKLVQETNLKSR